MRSTLVLVLVPVALAALSATRVVQSLIEPANRRTQETEWSQLVTAIANPDLHAVIAFCLIGLLVSLNLILRFPDLGAVIERCNQF
jgi:hypothetical protein